MSAAALTEDFCLICNVSSKDATIFHSLLSEDHPHKSKTGDGAADLDEHLSVILLLRKVLCLRKAFLAEVLESNGKDPSSWNVRLCQLCRRTFEEASFVWNRLKTLHLEFEQISEILRCRLERNVQVRRKQSEQEQNEVDKETVKRGKGRPPGRRSIKATGRRINSNVSSSSVASQGVVEAIRQEFLRRREAEQGDDTKGLRQQCSAAKRTRFQDDGDDDEHRKFSCKSGGNVSGTRSSTLFENANYLQADPLRIQVVQTKNDSKKSEETDHVYTGESDPEDFNVEDQNDNFDDMDLDVPETRSSSPEINSNDTGGDKDSDGDFDPGEYPSGGEVDDDMDSLAGDSDFKLSNAKSSKTSAGGSRGRGCRKNPFVNGERGVNHRAIKSKNKDTFECSKCQKKGFKTASECDEHILNKHYGGTWPLDFACTICENRSFKGENWLRYHMQMRHPGTKLPSDELVERCIKDGTITKLTYEVVPYPYLLTSTTNQGSEEETVNPNIKTEPIDPDATDLVTLDEIIKAEPSASQSRRIPVRMTNGSLRYILVPEEFFKLPEDIVSKFTEVAEDKMCDKKFPTVIQHESHYKRTHEGDKYSYHCPMCPKKFERIGHLILKHMLLTHVPGRFHCDRCGNMFKEDILLNAHIQRVHLGIEHPYQCLKCGIRHPRRASLNKHLKRVHKLQLKCYVPERKGGRVPGSKKPIKPVKKRTKLQLKYQCDTCSKEFRRSIKFATIEELDVHQKRQHMGISRPYPCTICKKKYSRPWLLDNHMITHTVRSDLEVEAEPMVDPNAAYVCAPCNKEFKTKSQFDAHNQGRNHKNFRPYVCELCCQTFRGLRYLQNHQEQKHHKELNLKPSKCKYCGKILSSPRTLVDHIKIKHEKNAKFKCPLCDTHFQFESSMERHMNVRHTRATQHLCPHCPKSFMHFQYLQNHLRIHTGEKPYECKICSKKFADRSTYNRHVEAHDGKIHECPECKKTGFKTRHALGVHMKTHRGITRNSRSTQPSTNMQQFHAPPEESSESKDINDQNTLNDEQAPRLNIPEQETAHSSARVDGMMPTLYPSFKVDDHTMFL